VIHSLSAVSYALVLGAGFLGGFVDAIAGGGGLVVLPALFAAGIPPILAAGTNKAAASFGSGIATFRYGRAGHILPRARLMAPLAFGMSLLGATWATHQTATTFRAVILCALAAVAFFLLLQPEFGKSERPMPDERAATARAVAMALAIGFYDGAIGPGTGSFLAFGFVNALGTNLMSATGSAKLINFSTNVAALLVFAFRGLIIWPLAIPLGLAILAGSYAGSGLAIRAGVKLIRAVLVAVVLITVFKMALDRPPSPVPHPVDRTGSSRPLPPAPASR
jgi:hypothetical protein